MVSVYVRAQALAASLQRPLNLSANKYYYYYTHALLTQGLSYTQDVVVTHVIEVTASNTQAMADTLDTMPAGNKSRKSRQQSGEAVTGK